MEYIIAAIIAAGDGRISDLRAVAPGALLDPMTSIGLLQIFLFFLVMLALTKPVGAFMARLFEGERTFLHPVVRPLERLVYKLSGVDETAEQHWTHYAGSLLAFSLAGILLTYLIQRIQGMLPFNPQGFRRQIVVTPTWRLIPPSVSAPIPTGRPIRPKQPPVTSPRWWGWPCITSLPRRPASPLPSRVVRGFSRRSANPSATSGWISPAPRFTC